MRKILPVVLAILLLNGCAFVSVTQEHYKRGLPDKLPQQKELSFTSKEALAAGASLQNVVAAKVYYKGVAPESADAKVLYDMSYRFMGLAGINMDFDPSDPESVKKVFAEADNAIKEKDKNIDDLKRQVDVFMQEIATKTKIVKDKEAEMEANDGKWKVSFFWLKFALWTLLILIILVPIGLFLVQIFTGIPIFTLFMKTFIPFATGGVKTVFNGLKQTGVAIEETKKEIKEEIEKKKAENKNYEAQAMEFALTKLMCKLGRHQDTDVKQLLPKIGLNKDDTRN
jgi:hypothetical protein